MSFSLERTASPPIGDLDRAAQTWPALADGAPGGKMIAGLARLLAGRTWRLALLVAPMLATGNAVAREHSDEREHEHERRHEPQAHDEDDAGRRARGRHHEEHDGGLSEGAWRDGGESREWHVRREPREARDAERAWLAGHAPHIPRDRLRAEETRYARHLARLHRIRELAAKAKDDASLQRIDALLAKEEARHQTWAEKHAHADMPEPAAPDGGARERP